MYKLFMALRYLRAHRIIYFSIAGVAMGIMVMIVVTSVMGGFSRDIQRRIRGVQSPIIVRAATYQDVFPNHDELAKRIRGLPHVTGCAPRLEYIAWLTLTGVADRSGSQAGRFPDVQVMGIDPEQEKGTGELENYFKRGGHPEFSSEIFRVPEGEFPALIVGSEISRYRKREVLLQSARQSENFPVFLNKSFQVRGWFKSGMAEYDSHLVFMHISEMQKYLRFQSEPYANSLAVGVDDYDLHGREVRAAIIDLLHSVRPCEWPVRHKRFSCGLFDVRTWEEERRTLLQAVEVEKGIQSFILFFIVIVAGFNIIAIYTLMVRAKTRDVGILKSLGATPGGVTSVFLLSGGACGLVGSIVGIGLGLLLSHNLNEIVDFVRIGSRELNALRLEGSSVAGGSLALCLAAVAALIVSWIRLYRPWSRSAWVTAGISGILFGVASWVFFAWIPTYEVRETYDWPISAQARFWISVVVGCLPIAWTALRRVMEPVYLRFAGGVFRFLGTVLYSLLTLGGLLASAVSLAIVVSQPDARFEGYDLFPRHIYYLDRVPVLIDTRAIAVIVVATLVVSVVFSIYPAIRAARTDPIEALRDE